MIGILASKSPFYLDGTRVQQIKSIADANLGYSSGVAQNIMEIYDTHYPPSYRFPEGGSERSINNYEVLDGGNVKVYPNPAASQVFFEKVGFASDDSLTLKIVGLTGQLIYQGEIKNDIFTFDLRNIQPGIYFFEIFGGNNYNQSGKISIVK